MTDSDRDLDATRPADPLDLAATVPARADDLAATAPAGPPAPAGPSIPGRQVSATGSKQVPHHGIDGAVTTIQRADPDLADTKPASDPSATLPATLMPSDTNAQTRPADPAAQTRPGDAAQTRPAASADETMVAGSTDARATVAAGGGAPGETAPGGSLTGTFSRTNTRLSRTRVNQKLQPQDQHLDQQLQLSRTSVLTEMTAVRTSTPDSLKKLSVEQGTDARYAVNRPLAAGGMGAVLHIEDNDFRRGAAMKVIHARFAEDANALERFLAEAQVTAQLEHPNIVPIHDLGVMADGTLYFTMKLIEGVSLGDVVKLRRINRGQITEEAWFKDKRKKDAEKAEHERKTEEQLRADWEADKVRGAELDARFTIEETILTFLKVLDGVSFAHSRGVVHRDIKPDNLMLGAHGEVLVVDWGIAKVLKKADTASEFVQRIQTEVVSIRGKDSLSATLDGSAMGTPFYMPPEQITGDLARIDGRSDIYALGATLYELLSLKKTFDASSMQEVIAIVASGSWTPLDQAMPELHQDLVAIVHRSMALQPENRYADCQAFADDLRRYLAGQAVLARQRNLIERIGSWVAAHRTQVQFGAVALVLVGGAVWGTVAYTRSLSDKAFAAKLAESRRLFADGQAAHDLAMLRQASESANGAEGIRSGDPAVAALLVEVKNAIAREEAAKAARDAEAGALAKAKDLAAEAQRREDGKDFAGALEMTTAALQLTPLDQDLGQRRDRLRDILANLELENRRRQAVELADGLGQRLARLAQADLGSDATATDLAGIKTDLDRLNGLPPTASGPDLVVRYANLAADAERARSLRQRADEALPFKQKATAATTAGDFEGAKAAYNKAKALSPEDRDLGVLWERLVQAESLAAEKARQAQAAKERDNRLEIARKGAARLLALARGQLAEVEQARTRRHAAEARGRELRRTLAAAPTDKQGPFLDALRERRAADDALAEHWATGEGQANQGLAALSEFPDDPLVGEIKGVLADFYIIRLRDARRSRVESEIKAYHNFLARVDQGRYRRELADLGTLTVAGAPAGTTWRPVAEGPDSRLVASGEATALVAGRALELPAGSYELRAGGTVLTVSISADHPVQLAWPGALPAVPGHQLAYVPAPDGGKGFALGLTEVTRSQWCEFLNQPDQLAAVNAAVQAWRDAGAPAGVPPTLPGSVPVDDKGQVVYFRPLAAAGDGTPITSWQVQDSGDLPVARIDRPSAQAFCTWLSSRSGQKVRLPKSTEWQFAASGGDDRRVYPWGGTFLPAFTTGARSADGQPRPVGSRPEDTGPFGHKDLAGNVREWLGDTPADGLVAAGDLSALIAGGAFSDAEERTFTCTSTESLQPEARNPAIGLRILVEIP